jgi:D-sedoheptulose 7-phosphate isomerase
VSNPENIERRIEQFAGASIEAHRRFFETGKPAVAEAAGLIIAAIRAGGKLMILGNGGSAADAQHLAAELAFSLGKERRALPAIALTTDSSLLTAISNDRHFDYVFSRQIQAIGSPKDVILAITTSGNSRNVIEAVKEARTMNIRSIGLLGAGGGRVASMLDLALIVPHDETPRIQEVHITIGHILCQLIEDDLCPTSE